MEQQPVPAQPRRFTHASQLPSKIGSRVRCWTSDRASLTIVAGDGFDPESSDGQIVVLRRNLNPGTLAPTGR